MGTTKKGRGKGGAAEDFSFQVDLKGIIRLLSENLYSSADVFLRELLQNAVDAIEARRAQEPDFTNGKIWIAYHTDCRRISCEGHGNPGRCNLS